LFHAALLLICSGLVCCRAPEILLGAEQYTEAVDMWSLGAIFGELLNHEPLFPGKSEADMLAMMCSMLGTPSDAIWPVCFF
jgi:serine/threonine protein kinase